MKSSLSNLPKFDRKKAYMLLSTLWVITKDSWNRRMACFLRHSVVEPTTTTTFLCFELEQIRGHFTSWGPPLFVGRSGLGFAPTQSIAKILAEILHSYFIKLGNLSFILAMLWVRANLRPLWSTNGRVCSQVQKLITIELIFWYFSCVLIFWHLGREIQNFKKFNSHPILCWRLWNFLGNFSSRIYNLGSQSILRWLGHIRKVFILWHLNFPSKMSKNEDTRKIPENQLNSNWFWGLTALPCYCTLYSLTNGGSGGLSSGWKVASDFNTLTQSIKSSYSVVVVMGLPTEWRKIPETGHPLYTQKSLVITLVITTSFRD